MKYVVAYLLGLITYLLFVYAANASGHEDHASTRMPPRCEGTYTEDPGPTDEWFGRLVIRNKNGSPCGGPSKYESTHGTIHIHNIITVNKPCYFGATFIPSEKCADIWSVRDLPPGVIASVNRVTIMEGATDTIYFYRFELIGM